MALTTCNECGEQISTAAKTCPKCGKRRTTRLTWLGLAFIVILVAYCSMEPQI